MIFCATTSAHAQVSRSSEVAQPCSQVARPEQADRAMQLLASTNAGVREGLGSIGVTPKLKDTIFQKLESEFGLQLPTTPGLDTLACIDAAFEQRLKFGFCLGDTRRQLPTATTSARYNCGSQGLPSSAAAPGVVVPSAGLSSFFISAPQMCLPSASCLQPCLSPAGSCAALSAGGLEAPQPARAAAIPARARAARCALDFFIEFFCL